MNSSVDSFLSVQTKLPNVHCLWSPSVADVPSVTGTSQPFFSTCVDPVPLFHIVFFFFFFILCFSVGLIIPWVFVTTLPYYRKLCHGVVSVSKISWLEYCKKKNISLGLLCVDDDDSTLCIYPWMQRSSKGCGLWLWATKLRCNPKSFMNR